METMVIKRMYVRGRASGRAFQEHNILMVLGKIIEQVNAECCMQE